MSARAGAAGLRSSHPGWLAALTLVLVGVSMRTPITSLAAAVPDIRDDLGLDATTAGLLTSIPVWCYALGAPLVAGATRRFGVDRTILVGLLVIAAMVAVRPWGPAWLLVAATAVMGLAITSGNVLLPVVVRRDFPHRQGPMTAVTTSSLTGGAALAAAATVPLIVFLGWRWAVASWSVLAVLGAVVWLRAPHARSAAAEVLPAQPVRRPWTSPGVWLLALFFAMQSGLFYIGTAWLPTLLPAIAPASATQAGAAASVFQLVGLAGTLTAPVLLTRVRSRRLLVFCLTITWPVFALGLLVAPSAFWVWCAVGGFAQGATFALGMALVTVRAVDAAHVRSVAAVTQTVGYAVGASGPVAMGALYGATGSWTAPLTVLLGLCLAIVLAGVAAASRRPLA